MTLSGHAGSWCECPRRSAYREGRAGVLFMGILVCPTPGNEDGGFLLALPTLSQPSSRTEGEDETVPPGNPCVPQLQQQAVVLRGP